MGSFTLPSAVRDFSQRGSFAAPAPRRAITQMPGQIAQGGRFDPSQMPGGGGGWGNVDQARPNPRQVRRNRARNRRQGRVDQSAADQGTAPQSEQMQPGGGFLAGGNMLGRLPFLKQNMPLGAIAKQQLGFGGGQWQGPGSLGGGGNWQELAQTGGNMAPPPAPAPAPMPGAQLQGPASGQFGPGSSAAPPQLPQAPGRAGGNMFGAQGPGQNFLNPAQQMRRRLGGAGQTGQGAGWGFLTNG